MHESEKWKWSCSVVSDSLQPRGLQPSRLLRPWDFPVESTGVGFHCLRNKFQIRYTSKSHKQTHPSKYTESQKLRENLKSRRRKMLSHSQGNPSKTYSWLSIGNNGDESQWDQVFSKYKLLVFIPIPKKGNAKECSNYRTIAFISHTSNAQNSPSQASAIHEPWTSRWLSWI